MLTATRSSVLRSWWTEPRRVRRPTPQANSACKPRSDGYLNVSFIGYESQKVPIAGKTTVNIQLKEDITAIDDVLVVAFGTTKKEAFTGSASVIKSEDLQKRQTTNVMNALVGSVAGLQMRGGSGTPGSDSGSINIRGISSMYADTDPLIIVDGAPYSASLSNIPQSDIESVTVLKDAASAALYGARGASGVIIVTTKRSQARDAVINVDMKWGVNSRAVQDYDVITDPGEYYEAVYAQYYNRYFYGQGMNATTANAQANTDMLKALAYDVYTRPDGENLIGLDGKLNPNATLGRKVSFNGTDYWMQPDDWTDAAYKNSLRQEYNVSVNGGTDKATYYTSVGYLNEDGIVDNSGYERISARIKADYQAKKWLKLGANVGYIHSSQDLDVGLGTSTYTNNLFYYTSRIAPIYPIYVRTIGADGKIGIKRDPVRQQGLRLRRGRDRLRRDAPLLAAGQPARRGAVQQLHLHRQPAQRNLHGRLRHHRLPEGERHEHGYVGRDLHLQLPEHVLRHERRHERQHRENRTVVAAHEQHPDDHLLRFVRPAQHQRTGRPRILQREDA